AWYELEGLDRIYYARYASGTTVAINERVVGYTDYDGAVNSARREELEVDAQGNAYLLWRKHGTRKLFLEKIGSDGNTLLDDYELFNQWGNDAVPSDFDLDNQGNLHLLTLTDWGKGVCRSAYGTFTPQGVPLEPLRWILYKPAMNRPRIMVDNQQDVQIAFSTWTPTGYPSCEDYSLCYLGTAFDPAAYDLSRSDLGVDAAHLSYQPLIARWNGTVAITTTVFNEGWASASANLLWIGLETEEGQKLAETTQTVNALASHAQQTFQSVQLALPSLPPEGMEEMEYLRLHFKVDPQNALAETSEANNELSVPILVQKLPTKTGLFLVVEDETYSVRGGDTERVNVGAAAIQGGSYSKSNIPVTSDVTVLAEDIPVTDTPVNYTISWQAAGYTVPTPAVIGVKRNSSDPYRIDFAPSNTAVLRTNRWGSLSGTITNGGGAKVRLVGQGLSIETTADAGGNFSPTTESKLGKLIPGEYQIRISKAGYARLSETITIQPLGAYTYNRTMNTTTDAYLHGNVLNQYGTPVSGANVKACSATTQTDANGVFDLTVAASCTKLEITRSGYAKREVSLSLTAGLETLLNDQIMTFDPPVTLISKEGRVASRVIDQSTAGLLPDAPEDASWVESQIFGQFKSKFWPDYRVYVAYGAYAYNGAAAYSGPSGDRRMRIVQVYFKPLTFEVHALLATIKIEGAPITLPIVSDSGIRSAIQVIEARLVNVKSGQVLKTVGTPFEGPGSEWIYDQGLLTYDFGGEAIADWENTEVWLYYKVGKNEGGQFTSSPLLYQHDRQIMKFDLSSGTIWLDYGLGEFPFN
ncbi:MAG: carboxypeptidase-like regulatory domain-containing protein, partial [Anaerolineales bacterium]|nr:carboxypeptidase-like regulatory domain-containing protein [Anaerolineales bacterium]MDW8447288.1 carboxypeptidase-like regulatory domain-containing protein [Anaerolineales bacterium]